MTGGCRNDGGDAGTTGGMPERRGGCRNDGGDAGTTGGMPERRERCRNDGSDAGMTGAMPERRERCRNDGGMTSSLQGGDDVAHLSGRRATRSSSFITPARNPAMIRAFRGWTCQYSLHRLDRDGTACEARSSPRSVSAHSPPRSHQPSCQTFHFPPYRRATPRICSTTSTGSSG